MAGFECVEPIKVDNICLPRRSCALANLRLADNAHLLAKKLDEKAAKLHLRRQFLDERAAKLESEPSSSVAADNVGASQEVEKNKNCSPFARSPWSVPVCSVRSVALQPLPWSSLPLRSTRQDSRSTLSRESRGVRIGESHTSASVLISLSPRTPCCSPWHDSFGARNVAQLRAAAARPSSRRGAQARPLAGDVVSLWRRTDGRQRRRPCSSKHGASLSAVCPTALMGTS